ncbi:universal stress protein [Streptomyces sp. SYP-A7185]|uniref:universal stress protein n=1 Tax=Streptomyces sp. SYP-A7185 TaxID=3040076 RepID=UPI0038F5FC33
MLRSIVVGLDGSRESVAAADWAAREAVRRGLTLRLVHAWEVVPGDDQPVSPAGLRIPQYWAGKALRTAQRQLVGRYPQLTISAEQIRRPAVPALVTEGETAELLVLGNQGFGGLGGLLAGSVATAVVGQVRCPVVLVRADACGAGERLPEPEGSPSTRTPCRKVVLCVDVRNESDPLLEFAFEEAHLRRAPLRVVYAWQVSGARADRGRESAARTVRSREAGWALDAVLEPWREKFPDVEVRTRTAQGRPVREVLGAACGAGLLVVGRRVRHVPVGGRVGRVTHTAIHRATCPVAVVAHD